MKRLPMILLAAVAVAFNCTAERVSSDSVVRAVDAWVALKAQMECPIKGRVSSVRLCTATNGAAFYVAKLTGGGFVVTSTDTEIDPVIAFSPAPDLAEGPRSPLWSLLVRDMGARQSSVSKIRSVAGAGSRPMGALARSSTSPSAARWARLLSLDANLRGAGSASSGASGGRAGLGAKSLSDVRVAPLLQTKWGQDKDTSGAKCFNYFTPDNCVCGCTATAWAQILRYHKFPTEPVKPKTYEVSVKRAGRRDCYEDYWGDWVCDDMEQIELTQMGGVYDWDNMPYVPGRGTTDYQRQCIGKLTYDIGLAVGSGYSKYSTWGYASYFVDVCLDWGYSHAKTFSAYNYYYDDYHYDYRNSGYYDDYYDDPYYYDDDYPYYYDDDQFTVDALKSVLIPNLDAKLPVGVRIYSMYNDDLAHFVVADGYGYSGEQFSVHLNMGWSGDYDAWYVLPGVTVGYDAYTSINELYGNIYPHGPNRGAIASGRILDSTTSRPVSNIVVTACDGFGNVQSATSDANGIYAFVLPEGDWDIFIDNSWPGAYLRSIYDSENKHGLDFEVQLYTVTFDANGGNGTFSRSYNARLGTLPTASRAGYKFLGWFTSANGGSQVTESTMVTMDTTYYAHWVANNYTVVFDANGGEGSMAPMMFVYDKAGILSPNEFTKGGAVFRGWSLQPRRRVMFVDGESVKNLAESGSVTLYAVWEGDPVIAVLGENCSLDLENDLGVVIDADYAAGDKVTVKVESLPKGIKLSQDKNTGAFILSGTPTEPMDFLENPAFARVTVTKKVAGKQVKYETLQRILLDIAVDVTREFVLGDDLTGGDAVTLPDDVTAVSGQPSGLKFTAKDVTKANKDKSVAMVASAQTVYGTPTRPGLFMVTLTHKNGKITTKTVEYWRVTVDNPGIGAKEVGWGKGAVKFDDDAAKATILQGAMQELALDLSGLVTEGKNAAKVTVSGLPSGLKFDAKTGKITGVATKVEAKVVTVKVVQNGLTIEKRFAVEVAANPFAGTYHAFFHGKMATAVVTAAVGGTAKLVMEEFVPSKGKTVKYTMNEPKGFEVLERYDSERPSEVVVRYVYTLKADERNNPDFGVKARTVELEFRTGHGTLVLRDSDGYYDTGFADVLKTVTREEFDQLKTDGYCESILPVLTENHTEYDLSVQPNTHSHFGCFSETFDVAKLQYNVKGKLWDGTVVSVVLPLVWDPSEESFLSVPFYVQGKKSEKRVLLGTVSSSGAGLQLLDATGDFSINRDVCGWETVPATAAEAIGKSGGRLVFSDDEWPLAPEFRVVVNGSDLARTKLDIFASNAEQNARALASLSPVKLVAGSGYVFKGSFKWDTKTGGDGSTYTFEMVPMASDGLCFAGRCEVKPVKGAATILTIRLLAVQ